MVNSEVLKLVTSLREWVQGTEFARVRGGESSAVVIAVREDRFGITARFPSQASVGQGLELSTTTILDRHQALLVGQACVLLKTADSNST